MTTQTKEAEKKRARWVAHYYHPFQEMVFKCSSCEAQGNRKPRFCPNCGAQMANPHELPDEWRKALNSC